MVCVPNTLICISLESDNMPLETLLKPRHVITSMALVAITALAITNSIEGRLAATMIIGILLSYGTYQIPSPRQKKE